MSQEIDNYLKEFVPIKRQIRTLKARSKELVFILLPEIKPGAPITIDGACVYRMEDRDSKRLNRTKLQALLVEKYGQAVADEIIESSTVTSNVVLATVAVRFPRA